MAYQKTSIPYESTKRFSKLFLDYSAKNPQLASFHSGWPTKESLMVQMDRRAKEFSSEQREILCNALESGMKSGNEHEAQVQNLSLLKNQNTFSVSCGHQLSVAGGPMYMAFKILSTIKLARELKSMFPEKEFVPIFWMASEDHDLAEIQAFQFFSKANHIEIKGEGAVGQLSCEGIENQLLEIKDFPVEMASAYEAQNSLAEASRNWLNHYFGQYGLLILEPDNIELKASFLPEMLAEIEGNQVQLAIEKQTAALEHLGYEGQIHAREVNLFYHDKGIRTRLIRDENGISCNDGSLKWSLDEARNYFQNHPEKLSPNVCLRPAYSQKVLPDLAFIGGPAEICYWLQLKPIFDNARIPFPILIPRFSALMVSSSRASKLEKLGLKPEDIFTDESVLRRKLALGEDDFSLPELQLVYSTLLEKAASTDSTLVPALQAEIVRMEKMAEGMQKRIRKAAEQKEELRIKQLAGILEYFLPGGGLLERSESWLSQVCQDPQWLDKVLETINPLEMAFAILLQEESKNL
jgi:bacillithiol biosynthesis cysteine-adding enzyme BshC